MLLLNLIYAFAAKKELKIYQSLALLNDLYYLTRHTTVH